MSVCTFFGHRDCPKVSESKLREILTDLIENHNVDMFYVGHQGAFDSLVSGVLRELAQEILMCNTPLCWPICPQSILAMSIIPTPCSRRGSSWFTPAMPSPGVITGCSNRRILWLRMWGIPGAARRSMCKRLSDPAKPSSTYTICSKEVANDAQKACSRQYCHNSVSDGLLIPCTTHRSCAYRSGHPRHL